MAISFQNALGIHESALNVRSQRAEILANNLVNADTPGFKSRDMDFKAILKGEAGSQLGMAQTNAAHFSSEGQGGLSDNLLYRNPSQPSIDGNTVDSQVEIAEYLKNTMDFQASFQFLNSKFKGLSAAIRGE